jgi:hypothetical protein
MISRRALSVAIVGACLYSTALGVLLGIVVDRIRFDAERAALLSRLTTAEHQVRARLMDLEGQTGLFIPPGPQAADTRDRPGS